MLKELRTLSKNILENRHSFEWSVQGFGMLRLYLPNNARFHVWDSRLRVPNVSLVHDHLQWALESRVISGVLKNIRYMEGRGEPYHWAQFKAGYDAKQLHDAETMLIERQAEEIYLPGDTYSQLPNEVHESRPIDSTITIMHKESTQDGETARIFWPQGTEWVSAEPRKATKEEIENICSRALSFL